MTRPMGVPVVRPSNTPERIFTASASCRCEVWREVPVRRRSTSFWMSLAESSMPGGQPSTMQPSAAPWLSPKVVTENSRPKVLPDTRSLLVGLGSALGRELLGAQQENLCMTALELQPGEGQTGIGLFQRPTAVAHLHHQDAVGREITRRFAEDAAHDVEAVLSGGKAEPGLVAVFVRQGRH